MWYHYGLGVRHAYSHKSLLALLSPVQEKEEFISTALSPPLNLSSPSVSNALASGTATASSHASVVNPLFSNVQVSNANSSGCNPSNATFLSTMARNRNLERGVAGHLSNSQPASPRPSPLDIVLPGHHSPHSTTLDSPLKLDSDEDVDSNIDSSSKSGSSDKLTSDEHDREGVGGAEDDASDDELVA